MWRLLIAVTLFTMAPLLATAAEVKKEERDYQSEAFKTWWGNDLQWKLADLPTEGKVPDARIPYSGHDYPDRAGGTDVRNRGGISALGRYDKAFNKGRGLAVSFERQDVTNHKRSRTSRRGLSDQRRARLERLDRPVGLFERMRARRSVGWYGHCNGWTAASIRHAEPQKNVVRNGITFTPADIKALLAEIYMYSDTEFLGGIDSAINPATLHVVVANWIGRGDHPLGMETEVGKVVINYPAYAFKTTIKNRTKQSADVTMVVTYATNTGRELQKSPRNSETMRFHYTLELDNDGTIVGGRYSGDSAQIDMLWSPLKPTPGGSKGNELGSPHINIDEVMSIWRDSVPVELREKWLNIDPYVKPSEKQDLTQSR